MSVTNTFSSGTAGGSYTPNTYSEFGSMIGKVARQVLNNVLAYNPLSIFDKSLEDGDTIEEAVIKMAEAYAFPTSESGGGDTDRTAVFKKKNPTFVVRYYKNWTPKQFAVTADRNTLRKVIQAPNNVENIAEGIVSSLREGDIDEHYVSIKALLSWASGHNTDGAQSAPVEYFVNKGAVALVGGAIDYKGILVKLKDVVKELTFTNTTCNKAGVKRRTLKDDIVIIMPYTIKNKIDVNELAGVFNLEKAEIDKHIIEVDTTDNFIYVLDRNALLIYTRLYMMTDIFNPKGLYANYYLSTERLYAISQLFDGTFFEVKTA